MSWTYTDPAASAKDAVRFLIGDTDPSDKQLQDEEITYLLAQYPNHYTAAANACEALANKFSRQVQKSVGRMSIAANQRADAYRKAAVELRRRRTTEGLKPFFGGRSVSEKESMASETDAVQPSFSIGQDDFPDTEATAYPPPRWGR